MAKRVFTEEERAEYREKMLDAGFDLLKQYGMTHMSVAKITEAAGIGVSTFYNFFASKEEYVYEVLQYRRRKIPELIRIALNGKEKAGPAETRTYLKMMIDERYSVFPSLTPEDEKRLLEMLPEQVRPDLQKETETSIQFFRHMDLISRHHDNSHCLTDRTTNAQDDRCHDTGSCSRYYGKKYTSFMCRSKC